MTSQENFNNKIRKKPSKNVDTELEDLFASTQLELTEEMPIKSLEDEIECYNKIVQISDNGFSKFWAR